MTAIGDLGFSDGEIRKLFDFWDMDGSGGIDFYECVALPLPLRLLCVARSPACGDQSFLFVFFFFFFS